MKITHYLYNAFLVEDGDARVVKDPDHHWQSDRVSSASDAYVIRGIELTRK